ncbi:unnamed protein product [Dicrocoelium dendriticum]|nr:unnamed protein product [Dicrocoelium dendriticum]
MGAQFQHIRNSLKRRLTRIHRVDRERWWMAKAREMEKTGAIGNSRMLFQPIMYTGPTKPSVSVIPVEKDGQLIPSQLHRLACWIENFEEQFSRPVAALPFAVSLGSTWEVDSRLPVWTRFDISFPC